jgi:hypothetical protein
MVQALLGTLKAPLKEVAIFAEVVKQPGGEGLLASTEWL